MVDEQVLFEVPAGVSAGWFHLGAGRGVVVSQDGALLVDGERHEGFSGVRDVRFSADGARVAFVCEAAGGGRELVIDGARVARHDGISPSTPVFARDGQSMAYTAREGEAWWVHCGHERFGPLSAPHPGAGWNTRPLVMDAAGRVLYAAKRDDVWALERNGEVLSGGWELVREPVCRASAVWARARRDSAWFVIRGSGSSGPFERLRGLAVSSDGARGAIAAVDGEGSLVQLDDDVLARPAGDLGLCVAFAGDVVAYQLEEEDGDERIVVGDRRLRSWGGVRGLVANPRGQVAYVGVDADYRERACVDDKAFDSHANIDHHSLALSDTGRVAYLIAGDSSAVGLDASVGPAYDGVWSDLVFDDHGAVHYIAQREGTFLRVRQQT